MKSSAGPKLCCRVCDSTEKLKKCTGCGTVYYCSRDHQAKDWKAHKKECAYYVKEKSSNEEKQKCREELQRAATIVLPNQMDAAATNTVQNFLLLIKNAEKCLGREDKDILQACHMMGANLDRLRGNFILFKT